MAKTPAWQRKEGQSPSGGLNAKGRASAKAEGHNLKPPQPEGGARKNSFCARMTGMKEKLTSKETANDPDSRINKSLRKWNCHANGGAIKGKSHILSPNYGMRYNPENDRMDSAQAKDIGFYGPLRSDDHIVSEYSQGRDGLEYPTLYPGMSGQDRAQVLMAERLHQNVPENIDQAAYESAINRISQGHSPFFEQGYDPYPVYSPDQNWSERAKGGPVWDKPRPKKLGKPKPLSSKEKKSAKAMAKAAGRPYPNLVDNMRAARAHGGVVDQAMEFVRRHRQEGGELEGDVQFAPEDKKFEDSGSLMVGRYGEDKPQPTAHEFVQQQLHTGEPQLPQYDPEAGIETAKEAAHLGAYMHPVTRPFAQAYDAYNAAREVMQNPKDPYAWGGLGLSTMFPGSSRATQLAGAAAAGAGVLGPDEAEAGPNTKFLTDLAHFYRSHYDPSARIFGAPTTVKGGKTVAKNWLSDVKLSRPVEEMSIMSQGHRPMVAERFMEPEEMAGKAMITGLGDRTPAGYILTHLNEKELAEPVNFMGGMGFGRDIASQGKDRSIWGSAKTRAQAIANAAKRAADEGMEPIFTYVAQGPQSGDFSHHMQDLILGQIQQEKMDKKLADFIDRRMRENQTASGSTFAPKPDWVGVKSPEMAERMRQRADERVKLTKLMDSATFRDAPGFADVGAARFAATEPSLMYDPSFSAGKSFMTINPRGEIVTNPIHPHPSYNTQIPAAEGSHGYLGRLEYELPPELHFKNYRENEIKPELRGKPLDKQTMSILKQTPTVVATPEWVDMASEYQDIMRRLYGRRRP